MNRDTLIKIINEKYSPLSLECQSEFFSISKIKTVKKGEIIVKEGQNSDKAFFIIEGCARAYYLKDGKDITDWFAFESDFICAINSFFENIPSPHYIETLDDAVLLEISREHTQQLSDKYHDFEKLSKAIVIDTMLRQQERIMSMQFQSAEQKYQNILTAYPTILQRVPLTHIASYIGITLETLSRMRKLFNRI